MTPEREGILRPGVIAGAIGYATVIAFYAAYNLATGHSVFATADILGRVLLGEPLGGPLAEPAAPIAVYNGLHLVIFLAMGIFASWLVTMAERHPEIWYLVFSLALFALLHVFGAVAAFSAPVLEVVPLWTVLAASLLSAGSMTAWLWACHPRLGDRVRAAGDLENPIRA